MLEVCPGVDVEGPGNVPRPRLDQDDGVQERRVPVPGDGVAPHPTKMRDLHIGMDEFPEKRAGALKVSSCWSQYSECPFLGEV